jgi:hypothetical protein
MRRPVDIYREMFLKDLSVRGQLTEQQAIQSLDANWKMVDERTEDPSWPADQRAARRIWAGIGLLVFGRLDRLVDVVRDLAQFPDAAGYKIARHYIAAIRKLVPFPEGLSLHSRPRDVLAWLEANRSKLIWDEGAGRVFQSSSALTDAVAVSDTAPLLTPPQSSLLALDFASWVDSQWLQPFLQVCRDHSLNILIPDLAMYDLAMHARRYDDWLGVVGQLRGVTDLIYAGRGVGEMMREEIPAGKPIRSVVDLDVTTHFRLLLTGLNRGDDTIARSVFSRMNSIIDSESRVRDHPDVNRTVVAALQEQWVKSLAPSDLESLERGDETVFVRVMSELATTAVVFQSAKNDGCTDDAAFALTSGNSLYSHLVYALLAVALDGLAKNKSYNFAADGQPDPGPDLDYLCCAAFCSSFPVRDTRLRRLYKMLNQAAAQRTVKMRDCIEADQQVPSQSRLVHLVQAPPFTIPCKLAA